MPILKATAGGGVHVKPGTYTVICQGVREDRIENSPHGNNDILRFDLEIEGEHGDDGALLVIDAIATNKLSPKSKAWEWCEAFGVVPEVYKDFDTDMLIGLSAQAKIIDRPLPDGAVFSRVDKLYPLGASDPKPVIRSDGSADWTVFWAEVKRLGLDKAKVAYHRGPDAPAITTLDGPDAAELLEELRKLPVDVEDLPFE